MSLASFCGSLPLYCSSISALLRMMEDTFLPGNFASIYGQVVSWICLNAFELLIPSASTTWEHRCLGIKCFLLAWIPNFHLNGTYNAFFYLKKKKICQRAWPKALAAENKKGNCYKVFNALWPYQLPFKQSWMCHIWYPLLSYCAINVVVYFRIFYKNIQ